MDILKQWRYKLLMPAGVFEISDYHTSAKFKRSERLNGRQILPRGDGAAIILSMQIVAVGWLVGGGCTHVFKSESKLTTRRSESEGSIWLDCEQALFCSKTRKIV